MVVKSISRFVVVFIVLICALLIQQNNTLSNGFASNTTPIKHLIIIFQENISFDHYFATYPNALNQNNSEPVFQPKQDTPTVNGLSSGLLTFNPNMVNPFRIPRSNASTCGNDHVYTRLQEAYNGGLMDKFVETNSVSKGCSPSITMGYFDGNTVTALWNYAQHYSMSDNFFASTFGPSAPGHINLISGQTHGVTPHYLNGTFGSKIVWFVSNGTLISDANPKYETCSNPATASFPKASFNGTNIGNLLSDGNITWGWFQGGCKPTSRTADGIPICASSHGEYKGKSITDYLPHHEPFQYYESTANPNHLPPTSNNMIGHSDQANHQYDISDFWTPANSGNLPSVSFIKAPAYQDGHSGYSNPLEEQKFLVDTINKIQNLPEWNSTAVIITYDDSDGWYDHVMPPIMMQSDDPATDALLGQGTGSGLCGKPSPEQYKDRCGYGPRLPFLVVSPYAKSNFVDHQVIDHTSILRFIEENWNLKQIGDQSFDQWAGSINSMFNFTAPQYRNLILDPSTGK